MYHYNFTNDLRISMLDEILKSAAIAFLNDSIPSEKSKNNNYMTVGFYFNLKAKGNCAKLASEGNIKKVVLNFIKKFQFPNLRTQADFTNAYNDGILLAPMREIVKCLNVLHLIDKKEAFLTIKEILNFIFYNNNLAKSNNHNIVEVALQIVQYRKNNILPSNINTTDSEHFWNQPDRQIREMIKTLNYTGCFSVEGDIIRFDTDKVSRDLKADLFEIISFDSHWTGKTIEEWQKYMDEGLENDEIINPDNFEDELIRIYNLEKNKDFAFQSIDLLKKKNVLSDAVIQNLTDMDFCKNKFKSQLSILKIIPENFDMAKIKDLIYIQGNNRYYQDIIKIGNYSYLIKNHWYKGSDHQDNNRSYFIDYIRELLIGRFSTVSSPPVPFPHNRITFGAPGTGKSFQLNEDAKVFGTNFERVTFHPNYSYAQFVGTYKPVQDTDDEKQILYQYVPGPFMRLYADAKKNQNQNFLLIVEEINRANVAAVFGDIFQLLDREDGVSEYPVAASEDIKKYLKQNGIDEDKLSIPSNMYIWATMNSADQGVFPMDTAFKRRWEFEYIGIDENEEAVKDYWIPINNRQKVRWNDLRKAINEKLISMKINEDKLLGPFFLSRSVLENAMDDGEKFIRLFKSKVLMYLFEDAAKMKPAELFDAEKRIFSVICNEFDEKGTKVFKFDAEIEVVDIEESQA